MSLRRAPFVGARVTVVFLARRVGGTIEELADGGRRVVVATDDGERIGFALSPATGSFLEAGRAVGGARMMFGD
jgi:hypothetical protein